MAAAYHPSQQQQILNSTGTGEDDKIMQSRIDGEKLQGTTMLEENAKSRIFYTVERAAHPEIRDHAAAAEIVEKEVEVEDEDKDERDADSDSWNSEDERLLNDEAADQLVASHFSELRLDLMTQQDEERRRLEHRLIGMEEKEALETMAHNEYVVCNFEHPNIPRTSALSWHLNEMAYKFPKTKFIAIDAERCMFIVKKFKVKTLPSMILLVRGRLQDKIIGFDDFGGADDFSTNSVIRRLRESGVVPDSTGKYVKKAPRTNTILEM